MSNTNSFINEILPYICRLSRLPLVVDKNINLVIKTSSIPSSLPKDYNQGVFTTKHIRAGTIIMKVDYHNSKINDGVVNLDHILTATTNEDTYHAWKSLWKSYYDLNKIKKVINVCMITDGKELFYAAIQDIPAGTELFRLYGFSTWPLELFDTITSKNILGFGKFIQELLPTLTSDPNEKKIHCIYRTIITILNISHINITTNLTLHDIDIADNDTVNMGVILKLAIINNKE